MAAVSRTIRTRHNEGKRHAHSSHLTILVLQPQQALEEGARAAEASLVLPEMVRLCAARLRLCER